MNTPIRRLARVVAALFAALLISSTVIQFIQAPSLRARADNRRTLLDDYSRERGSIIVADEQVARSVPATGELEYLRTYPQGELYSHVTGYYSFLYGAGGGIEGSEDALLSGSSDQLFYRRLADLFTGQQSSGASLLLTINTKAQEAADKALGNQRGAVVALDPRTGAILALVSHPQYDPNSLASHDAGTVRESWNDLQKDPAQPMVNRAITGDLYPPGSVFKMVTAAAALGNGVVTEESQIPAPAVMDLPETDAGLPNYDRKACGANDQTTLKRALEISCNTAFGYLGLQLGADALRDQAAKFGFGESIRIPMRATPSTVPAEMNEPQTAQAAIGQYDVRVTPLQIAMVAAAIGNRGVVMQPYLVQQVLSSTLQVLDQTQPQPLSQATTPEVAGALTDMLVSTVDNGTGTPARISGVSVAGKTGTAEQGNGEPPHAWFASFAPADNPQVAVAVVVEDGGNAGSEAAGGRTAGPIAKAVMEAVITK